MSHAHTNERLEGYLPAVSLRRHTPADTDTYSNANANAHTDSDPVHRQMFTDSKTSSYAASTPIAIQCGKSQVYSMV